MCVYILFWLYNVNITHTHIYMWCVWTHIYIYVMCVNTHIYMCVCILFVFYILNIYVIYRIYTLTEYTNTSVVRCQILDLWVLDYYIKSGQIDVSLFLVLSTTILKIRPRTLVVLSGHLTRKSICIFDWKDQNFELWKTK